MATLIAAQPIDMLAPAFFPGIAGSTLSGQANQNEVTLMEPDGTISYLGGQFAIGGSGQPASGTIGAIAEESQATGEIYAGTGFSVDYGAYAAFRDGGDNFGFVFAAMQGDDQIFGSTGADRLVGFDGNDEIMGGPGNDDVNGNVGADTVLGGAGQDFVRGGRDDDLVRGGPGDDWHVNGNVGNDTVYGDGGSDTVFGGQNADMLYGDYGDRSAFGGNDYLIGNLGRDSLYGEDGNDTLEGGAGFDFFFFGSDGDDDRIVDFSPDEDVLVIENNINDSGLVEGIAFSAIQARLSVVDGNTVFDLGAGDTVTIQGILPGQLQASHFTFYDV